MNSRERVLATLNHQQPDRPPRDLGGTSATGIHVAAYRALKRHLGLCEESAYLHGRGMLALVEDAILRRFGCDLLPLAPDVFAEFPELDERGCYTDRWGVEWRLPDDGVHFYVSRSPFADARKPGDLASLNWPEPNTDFTALGEKARRLRQTTDKALALNTEVGFLHRAQFMRGYEEWLVDLLRSVPVAEALLDRVLEVWLAETEAMIQAVKGCADVVTYLDDIAFQTGPMVSPRVYKAILKPRQRRVFDLLKSSGMKVFYHSCGNVHSLIGDLVEMGVDALNPVQVSAADMGNTADLKRTWGKELTFWGAIDTQSVLPRGTVADVKNEVWRRLDDLSDEGGYILASVHNIQAEVPPENVCAMFDAVDEWRH